MLGFKAFLILRSKKPLLFMVCTILSWQPCKRKMKRVTQVPAWPPTTKHPDHVWTQFLSAFIKSKKLPSGILSVSLTASITGEMLPLRSHQSCVLCLLTARYMNSEKLPKHPCCLSDCQPAWWDAPIKVAKNSLFLSSWILLNHFLWWTQKSWKMTNTSILTAL